MTAVIWPFPPQSEMIEELNWVTDVIRSKTAEQRLALRSAPRRVFQLSHLLTDLRYSHAVALIRDAQGADGFLVPDWGQSTLLGSVAAGASVSVSADLSGVDFGDAAILWQSVDSFEAVTLTTDSSGTTIDTVTGTYTAARLLPLWPADAPEGLSNSRGTARYNQVSIAMELSDNRDLSATPAVAYRSLDVLDDCPVIASGDLSEGAAWEVTGFSNPVGLPAYLRQRSTPDITYSMRWHFFTRSEHYALRQWLHYRRGRQKAFWMSSRGQDLEAAASISGTTVLVYAFPGLTGLGRTDPFDIEIKTASTKYYRRVSAITGGAPVDGRATISMTIDSSATVTLSAITRISFLRCTRLNEDRVEFLHQAAGGVAVQVALIEIPPP
jgi:hypothetical protein